MAWVGYHWIHPRFFFKNQNLSIFQMAWMQRNVWYCMVTIRPHFQCKPCNTHDSNYSITFLFFRCMFHTNRSAWWRDRLETESCRWLHTATTSSGGMDVLQCHKSLVTDKPTVNEWPSVLVSLKALLIKWSCPCCGGNLIPDDRQQEQCGPDSCFL